MRQFGSVCCYVIASSTLVSYISMPTDPLQNAGDHYDDVVIGGGLGGMTAANLLAWAGRSVLLAKQHNKLGGGCPNRCA